VDLNLKWQSAKGIFFIRTHKYCLTQHKHCQHKESGKTYSMQMFIHLFNRVGSAASSSHHFRHVESRVIRLFDLRFILPAAAAACKPLSLDKEETAR
jgi:hypothetical protein